MNKINVFNIVGREYLTSDDGYKIADEIVSCLDVSGDRVTIDFSGIMSMAPSTSSRLFYRLSYQRNLEDINRVKFIHVQPWIKEALDEVMMHPA